MGQEVSSDFLNEFNFASKSCGIDFKIGLAGLALIAQNLDKIVEAVSTHGRTAMSFREFINALGVYGLSQVGGTFKLMMSNATLNQQIARMYTHSGVGGLTGAVNTTTIAGCAAAYVIGVLAGSFIYASLRTTKVGNEINNSIYDSFYYYSLGVYGQKASETEMWLDSQKKLRAQRIKDKIKLPSKLQQLIKQASQ